MTAIPNSGLNPENHLDSHLRIIACAGSGKTSFVAKRIGHILSLGEDPSSIIAFTYTDKAAVELNNRVIHELKERGIYDAIQGIPNMYIGTIHGWCLKGLHDHEIGYQKFRVLDDIKLRLFVNRHFRTIGIGDISRLDNPKSQMRIFVDTTRFIELMNIVRESEHASPLSEPIQSALSNYESALRDSCFFDFTMIMTEALKKLQLEDGGLRGYVQDRLKYLIVDEYQDINPVQNKLIAQLERVSGCRITVVGDDDQNIYQWRGSNSRFLKDFDEQYVHSRPVESNRLDTNYRSSKGITGLAEHFIAHNKDRIEKSMRSAEKQSFVRDEDVLFNEYGSRVEECQSIAKRIKDLYGLAFTVDGNKRGLDYSDFAVLLRTWAKSEEIAAVLDAEDIPYITSGVNQLFQTKEVQAALAIFQYLNGLLDADLLLQFWEELHGNRIDPKNLKSAVEGLARWRPSDFQKDRKSVGWGDFNLQEIYWEFLRNAQITEEVFHNDKPTSKLQAEVVFYNLGKFSQVIHDYEEINLNSAPPERHLFNFLNFITYIAQDYYPEGWLKNPYKTPKAVQLMTIHQAKGLEFPVVFIPALNKNYFPQKRAGGLNVWHFLERSAIRDQSRYEARDEIQRFEDERRLLYVAITRSQKFLFISRAPEINNQLYRQPSPFVAELVCDFIQEPQVDISYADREHVLPQSKEETINLSLSFSILKDIFECGYRFKLISMYGFCYPLNQRMGLGKSTHDSLMAIHKRASKGEKLDESAIVEIANGQSHFPFLGKSPQLQVMKQSVVDSAVEYYRDNAKELENIEFVEQDVRLSLDDGIFVTGRIDLVKKKLYDGQYETTIVEFKSDDGVQEKTANMDQLNLYALGYRELVGRDADYVQMYMVGSNEPKHRTRINEEQLTTARARIQEAATRIREQHFDRVLKPAVCKECYQNWICSARIQLGLPTKKL